MGLKGSPYRSIQWQICLKLEVYWDRRVLSNPFHWNRVEFNLPGSRGYRPNWPWVLKIKFDGHLDHGKDLPTYQHITSMNIRLIFDGLASRREGRA